MKQLKNCLLFDLKKSIFCIGFVLKIFLIVFFILISQADILRDFYLFGDTKGYDIIGLYNLSIHYDTFKLVILVILTSIYSSSYCIEQNNNVFNYIVFRAGIEVYAISKIITIIVSVLLAYALGVAFSFGILSAVMPLSDTVSPIIGDSSYLSFAFLTPHEHPYLWIVLTVILFCSSILIFCILGLFSSLYIKDSMIVNCIPAISYFAFTSLTYFFPELFYVPAYGNHAILVSNNPWLNYIYKLFINIAVIVALSTVFIHKLRKQCDEGNC